MDEQTKGGGMKTKLGGDGKIYYEGLEKIGTLAQPTKADFIARTIVPGARMDDTVDKVNEIIKTVNMLVDIWVKEG